ncbi:MAG: hypothetical protein IKA43_01560 [Clostridia bacterium]|nr:hypothetical protein [Clostridia bacterium]
MKKALSFLLAFIFMVTFVVPVQIGAEGVTNVKVENVEGTAGQLVTVSVKMATDLDVTVGKLKIKYDNRLELVKYTNGEVFANTYSEVTGEEKGIFTYVGDIDITSDKTTISAKANDVILKLVFKIPANALATDEYSVSVVNNESSFAVTQVTDGVIGAKEIECLSSSGMITTNTAPACSAHTYGEEVKVREQSYLLGGYSYKTCSACGAVESICTEPIATNIFTPLGTAIRYSGNPSGIGAHFAVNKDAIKAIETAGFEIEIGIELSYGDRTESHVFYGQNTPTENTTNFEDGVISACIEGVKTQQKGTIFAYAKIIKPDGTARVEKTYNTLKGNPRVSIVDIVSLMNFNKYSQASKDYLNTVANGFVE